MWKRSVSNPQDLSLLTEPRCSVFGICGGCAYQDITYEEELRLKEAYLKDLLSPLSIPPARFSFIVPSPQHYGYRHRLDLSLFRAPKTGRADLGFRPIRGFKIVSVEACPIARKEISDFIPTLKEKALAVLPSDYRTANLTVRTGDDGKVRWGGIGPKSTRLAEAEYFWTEITGRRIYYSLNTFFQANLFILPSVVSKLRELMAPDKQTVLFDLYAGVGLFGFALGAEADCVVMIEDGKASVELMQFNATRNGDVNVEIHLARVENVLADALRRKAEKRCVALVDPPRKGLGLATREILANAKSLATLCYLSCGPESLRDDLAFFLAHGWQVSDIIPFDFFPRTKHLETLVRLVAQ